MSMLHACNPEVGTLRWKDGKFEGNLNSLDRHWRGGAGGSGVEDQPQLPGELPVSLGL